MKARRLFACVLLVILALAASSGAAYGDAGSAENFFAVGNTGTILRYDGNAWTKMDSGTPNNLYGVWGRMADEVFALGWNGVIQRYDGSAWTAMNSSTFARLYGAWCRSADDCFAVGSGGTILHYDGNAAGAWTGMASGTGVWIENVCCGDAVCYAVGWNGTILREAGAGWTAMNSGVNHRLWDCWCHSDTDCWAVGGYGSAPGQDPGVGGNGSILRYDGSTWQPIAIGTTAWLEDVWCSHPGDCFAVGGEGTILHYDGNDWTPMTSGTTEPLLGVWGSGTDNVFAVGDGGTIVHYGSSWTPMDNPVAGTDTCLFSVWGETEAGTIVVEKQTDPDGAADTFTFSGDATGTIADGGTIVVGDLLPGTYTSQETVPAGWELTGITCDDDNSTGEVATGTATFDLEAGETVTCIFINRLKRGTIVVEKQTDPDGAAGSFTFSGDAAGTISDGGTIVVGDLLPGTYTAMEADPAPQFELTSISCDDGNSSGNLATRTATFALDPGETVKCTFSNAQRALRVSKEILWPVGGLAGLGQEIRYLITIENTGGVTVDPLVLRDEYDPWCLTSRKAEVPPDVHGGMGGFLQWNALGALAPGETTSLWAEFIASHACDPTANKARVQADNLWFEDEVALRILESIASIGGRVFHDETGAGTPLAGYRGVEGAQVSLDSLVYTTNTSGWYSFNLLDAGTYAVTAAPPAGSWWLPTTSETCAATVVNTWEQVLCNFAYWWGLDGPPLEGLAAQEQVTLTPMQDTSISGPEPGNHGAEENLWVRQPGLSSTLVQFDLSGLPAGAEIVWARLRLYGTTASNAENRLYSTACPVSKMWAEGEATWSEAAAGLPWEAAGATGAGDHGAPVGWAWTNTLGWVVFDLDPAVVGGWLADGGSNHGLLLRGEGSGNRRVAYGFVSQEHGNGAAHPQLVLGYNLP